jgi:hypothetical protein
MRRIRILLLLPLLLLAACDTKSLRLANYDLSNAINKAALTTINLEQNGQLTVAQATPLLSTFYTMSTESDAISKCIDNANAGGSAAGCITPILAAINTQSAQASLGVKSTTAQSTMSLAITGITAVFTEFATAGATAPAGGS